MARGFSTTYACMIPDQLWKGHADRPQQLLTLGILKECRSPYASSIMVDGYRALNSCIILDQYTMPHIDDALDCLSGSKWFLVLRLSSGSYQIAMAEENKEKTAIICPLGFHQFEHMPQGRTGALATFQWLMKKAVDDMHLLQVLMYLDDCFIIFAKTLKRMSSVFSRFWIGWKRLA